MQNFLTTIVFILGIYLNSQAQHFYEFSYDNSGNREVRNYIYLELKNCSNNDTVFDNAEILDIELNENSFVEELTGEKTLKIYPNPTQGLITVEIENYTKSTVSYIKIFDKQGKEIHTENIANPITKINLKTKAVGNYIMQVVIDDFKKNWVIVKY